MQFVRQPIYWVGFFVLPLFLFLVLSSLMEEGLPKKVPAAMVDKDGSSLSRQITQSLNGMEMVDISADCNSFSEAKKKMQEGEIFGFFLIPENFQADLLAGQAPALTYYTNMTFYVPANLLYKTFKTTAVYTKAGIVTTVISDVGGDPGQAASLLQPVNITVRGLGNPALNYAIYLCNSFIPCVLQLMIFLMTAFTLGEETKFGTSVSLMRLADGSIFKALVGKLLPQTLVWLIIVLFMESWLFGWNHYPMHGSWFWLTLSEVMFVLASQGFAIFVFGIMPNLRLSLSICALVGILSFSIGAFSFPVESMYPAVGIFSWIVPIRYNFLIYIDQALNGIHIYYSRIWFIAYIVFMLLPFTVAWRIKRSFNKPVYAP